MCYRPEHRPLHLLSIPHHPPLSSVDKVADSQQRSVRLAVFMAQCTMLIFHSVFLISFVYCLGSKSILLPCSTATFYPKVHHSTALGGRRAYRRTTGWWIDLLGGGVWNASSCGMPSHGKPSRSILSCTTVCHTAELRLIVRLCAIAWYGGMPPRCLMVTAV